MATSDNVYKILQCSKCENNLETDSKTLTCLHSLCGRCFDEEFQEEKTGTGHCPECQELVKINQLTLSSFLVNSLKRRQRLESTNWNCDVCLEGGDESLAKIWCKDCNKFFCDRCNRVHKSLPREKHNSVELNRKGKDKVREAQRTDLCNIHKKVEECYCDRCNVCLCNICYKTHFNQFPQCPSNPISVRKEAVKKRTSQGPTLLQEIEKFKNNLQERNRKSRIYSEGLERECDLKCEELWRNYEDILDELRVKTHEMCDELRSLKNEQVKKWQELVEENEKQLKKLEIWGLHLHHFLEKEEKDKNEMICGVALVGSKIASSSARLYQIIMEPIRKCELSFEFSDFWLQFIEGLQKKIMASVSLKYSNDLIEFETEYDFPELNIDRSIHSIIVSQKDCHIFLTDQKNRSVMEFTEFGELISECILIDKGTKFSPVEMVMTSSEILVVNCNESHEGKKLFFLERINFSPFLKIKTIIDKRKQSFSYSFSVCHMKKSILICDERKFQIDFYTENGEYIKTIDTGGLRNGDIPIIRADPSTGNFWGASPQTCEMFCFNENGQILESFKTKEKILNFYINQFGNFYFCNFEGMFSNLPEKKMHKFEKMSTGFPRIFVSKENVFVCLVIDNKYTIKIFKIPD